MDHEDYNLGTRPAVGFKYPSGIAYIVIPADIDRAIYIAECLKTGTVTIYSEHNGYSNRVPIDKFSLNFIDFPTDIKENGTAVSFTVDPIHNHPIINGIFFKADELCDLVENQFKFKRQMGSNFVEVAGSAANNTLQLNVNADSGGDILINVKSKEQSGKVTISVDGEIVLDALTDTTVRQHGKYTLTTIDRGDQENYATMEQSSDTHTFWDKHHHINTPELKINNGEEPIILGKKWASFMKDFIAEVGKSTVTTALGQMPLLNADAITEYQNKVDELLSTVGFIDK